METWMTSWFVHHNDMSTLFAEPFARNPCRTIGKGAPPQGVFALDPLESGVQLHRAFRAKIRRLNALLDERLSDTMRIDCEKGET